MGYPIAWFTTRPHGQFICRICKDLVQSPVVITPCEHAFCSACVTNWRESSKVCPIGSCRLKIKGIAKLRRPYLVMLNDLQMECAFKAAGCRFGVMKLGDWAQHEEKCNWNPENHFKCEGNCGAELTKYIRRTGSHNCVEYLKEIVRGTQQELAASRQRELTNGNTNAFGGNSGLRLQRMRPIAAPPASHAPPTPPADGPPRATLPSWCQPAPVPRPIILNSPTQGSSRYPTYPTRVAGAGPSPSKKGRYSASSATDFLKEETTTTALPTNSAPKKPISRISIDIKQEYENLNLSDTDTD